MYKNYCKFWLTTEEQLKDVLLREKFVQNLKPTPDRLLAHRVLSSLYGRYIILCNNLGDIYDQTLQVQKRAVVKKLLVAATRRLIDLQNSLKNLNISEFIYIDNTIRELQLTIDDVQLLKPYYFPLEREESLELQKVKEKERRAEELKRLRMFGIAIHVIKAHEKARQARRLWRLQIPPQRFINEPMKYEFYHKEDQLPLFPVKKYDKSPNFCQVLKNTSNYSFYVPPHERNAVESMKVVNLKLKYIIGGQKDDHYVNAERPTPFHPPKCATRPISPSDNNYLIIELDLPKGASPCPSVVPEKYGPVEIEAANKIKRFYLHWLIRKRVRMRQHRKLIYLGMIEDKVDTTMQDQIMATRERRQRQKFLRDKEFLKAVADERARIIRLKTPFIMEDISDHIREWFRVFYEKAGAFDKYPKIRRGGTILVIRGKTKTVEEFKQQMDKSASQKAIEKGERAERKDQKKQEKMARLAKAKQDKKDKTFNFQKKLKNLHILEETFRDYESNWKFIEEEENVNSNPYETFITEDIMKELHLDLRVQVDEFMRLEYELLRKALAKDRDVKYKKSKKEKLPKRKQKKRKIKKADITEDKTSIELYNQLVDMGIIRKYKNRRIEDLIGDFNLTGEDDRQRGLFPPFCMSDLKDTLRTMILRMGPLNFKTPSSLLLAGPKLSGKKLLVDALCSEVGAVMFDLSPENTQNIEDLDYFVAMIRRMTLWLQPSVIFINNVHRIFAKKKRKSKKSKKSKKPVQSTEKDGPDTKGRNDKSANNNDNKNDKQDINDKIDQNTNNNNNEKNDKEATDEKEVENDKIEKKEDNDKDVKKEENIKDSKNKKGKKTKENKTDEKENTNEKLRKVLNKRIIKKIAKDDKIFVVGTSNAPWTARVRAMNKCFKKKLLVPHLNYGGSSVIWRQGVAKMGFHNLDVTALVRVFPDCLSAGQILNVISDTLNIRRRMKASRKPIELSEFFDKITNGDKQNAPIKEKESKAFLKWFKKSNRYAKAQAKEQKRLKKLEERAKRNL